MTKTEDSLLNRIVNLLLIIVLLLYQSPATSAEELDNSAIIQLKFSEENSIKNITATLNEFRNDSIGDPIADVDLYFLSKELLVYFLLAIYLTQLMKMEKLR